jgi:hypothetical protein
MLSLLSAAASAQQDASLATGPIIDLDFLNISGSTVPDRSVLANDGVGRKGAVGFETSWSPVTAADSLGNAAVVFDGTQMQRIAIPNRSGSLDVNSYSILVKFTLDQSVDTDPLHQRYELMEKAGSFWFNVRQDTTPKYVLRTGAYFNGTARALTGTRVIPHNTLVWAIATYDGAQLKTYVANGDGSNLVLDSSKAQAGTVATGATITGIVRRAFPNATDRRATLLPRSTADVRVEAAGGAEAEVAASGSDPASGGETGTEEDRPRFPTTVLTASGSKGVSHPKNRSKVQDSRFKRSSLYLVTCDL